ncbi:uncharacterized protein [Parasteatoda tepidariorum]|uniref:uncharacterized protein n=1 Tax=Parasteatoda tepidariorum TaxID=114398 RepID=UPI001C71E2BA|nr:uncharacterized protein LOC107451292 [Parasteatoda tepidariorum]
MCESTFPLAKPKGITEPITKYNYVVSNLPPDVASLIRDILMKPDAIDPYEKLKEELIKRSEDSSQQEIRQLLSGEELGSRKPSDLLRSMKRRAQSLKVPNELMLELFLQRLPSSVQSILAVVSFITLDKAAEISDRNLEVTPSPVETFAISGSNGQSSEDRIFREIEKINKSIDCLSFRGRSPFQRNGSNPPNRSRSNSQYRNSEHCWYHQRFGKRCKPEKCVQPCAWQGNETSKE